MVSPALAPTWKVTLVPPLRRLMPLNWGGLTMRPTSAESWVISAVMAARSAVERVPLLYWTASSRTRCRMEWTSLRAPSPVCTMLTPSRAFWWAWARPLIWARIFSEMARPAASSAARLMRRPLDSFSMDLLMAVWVPSSWRWALNASVLVLTRSDMPSSLMVDPHRPGEVASSPDEALVQSWYLGGLTLEARIPFFGAG